MKKLLSLLMILVLCASFVACGASENAAVQEYVSKNKATLISSMEEGFEQSGLTCSTDVEVEGNGIVFTIKINQLDDISSAQKDLMQASYDAMGSYFDTLLVAMQKEEKEIKFYEIKVCEKDGDLLATITAGDK